MMIPRQSTIFRTLLAFVPAALLASMPHAVMAQGPAVLMDLESGRVLYTDRADQRWHPASLTKIMTAYLTFQAIRDGKLTLEQSIPVSEVAHAMPPSKIGLPVGAEMGIDLALRSLIIKSANDVAVMLAEAIDGSIGAFAERMNRTAARLGMTRSHFVNPNGLPDAAQVSSARDLAILTRAVASEFPEHAHYWATPTMQIGRIRLRSHNSLLRTYPGANGFKTGFICDSGFNVVATAERDGMKLAAVVLGETTPADRAARASSLLNHGFKRHAWKVFFGAPDLTGLAIDAADPEPPSIRADIRVWDCGGRRATARKAVPRARPQERRAGTTLGNGG